MRKRSKELNIFSMSALDLFASALGAFILITIVLFPFFPNTGDSPERVYEIRQEMNEIISQLNQQLEAAQAQASAAQTQLSEAQANAEALEQQNQQMQQAQADLAAAASSASSLEQAAQQCEASLQQNTSLLSDAEENLQSCRAAMQQTFALVVISWPSNDDVDLHVVDPAGNEYYYQARTFPGSNAALEEDNTEGPGNEIWLSPSAMPGEYEVYIKMYSKVDSGAVTVRGSILHQNGRQPLPDTVLRQDDEKPLVTRFTVADDGSVSMR